MDKFIVTKRVKKPSKRNGDGRCPVRIPAETYDVVRAIAKETQRPITRILVDMVEFCRERLEIREERIEENGNSIA